MPEADENSEVKDAIVALDGEDESLVRIIRASLRRRFPEQASFILSGVAPTTGPAAVLVVQTLLERLDQLPAQTDKKTANEALALLSQRGIDGEKRSCLPEKAQSRRYRGGDRERVGESGESCGGHGLTTDRPAKVTLQGGARRSR